ncbi:MAG TPA: hypothetical protein VKZ85_17530, partial [Woeseiaceae bacterium]|nr:hypothetical protein [Woeseiaceae bacterium]
MESSTATLPAAGVGGMGQQFHESLYLGLQALRGRPVGECIRQLRAWERLERPAFERLCRERLAAALARARADVP